jgi:glycosyltransferase involved in cell wall biosynthesis/2-polyprenyl-3-methyl-5-hydroxy-6-metoxy-1,4-benzoquinol methylase
MMVNACTIVARNYVAYARVLATSFLAHHPGGCFCVLLIDDEHRSVDDREAGLTCHRLGDIGLSAREIAQLASIYDVTELATAVKPQFLRFLLADGRDHVLYLDPDIKVYDSLEHAAQLTREHGIVLTPHMMRPLPRDGRRIDDAHILSSGIFNLGFIGLAPGTNRFLDWWWSRTRRDALIEPHLQMFTDQRWIDYVPSLFEPHILRRPGYNVAYWNLHERDVTWAGGRYVVANEPLAFFHFSGFSVDIPYLLSRHQGASPRVLLSERPVLRQICAEYRADLIRAGVADATAPYGWARLSSGLPYDRRMRRLYRDSLDAFERGLAPEPPSPFECESDFIAWLNEPVAAGPRPRVSRYLYRVYQDRPDLQAAFPNLAGVDAARYFLWLPWDGVAQEGIPAVLLPALDATESIPVDGFAAAAEVQRGVNVAGYFRAELGIGEAARLIRRAVEVAGVPHSTLDYGGTESRRDHPYTPHGDGRAPYNVNLLCVNADRTPDFARAVGPRFFAGRRTVGYWFWELEQFPAAMHAAFDAVDEVWTASRFTAEAIGRVGRRTVHHVPLGVPVPVCAPGVTRESLGLPGGFLFLFVFDFFSAVERKNPLGLIRAYTKAFRDGDGATLVLKSINGSRRLTELEQLRAQVPDRSDILLIDDYYDAATKNALIAASDCYVSLHRSEGFGLTMAEAMALGRPVIATGYSGNLDFMSAENSYLVDYTLGSVPAADGPYTAGRWANPSEDDAAALMRRVFEAREEAGARAARGRDEILTRHSPEVSAAAISRRLDAIGLSVPPAADGSRELRERTTGRGVGGRMVARLAKVVASRPGAPATSWAETARHRARQLILRAMGPYWRQRQLNAHLLNGLSDAKAAAERAAAIEPDQQRALAAVWSALHALETREHDTHVRFAGIETALRELNEASTLLVNRLHAPPYMDDPARFDTTAPDGRRVFGYDRRLRRRSDGYRAFEDIFRGPERLIRERQRVYVPLLTPCEPVVDLGCGRGEMLDLLREAGVEATGVDIDSAMVQRCRAKGHAVAQSEALRYLCEQPDRSLGAVFAAQMIEHLSHEDLQEMLRLSRQKLRPDGRLILETVNPHSLEAFKTFWTDLTHVKPIFPEVALAWCWLSGFEQAEVLFPTGSGRLEEDRRTQGQYAVLATPGA